MSDAPVLVDAADGVVRIRLNRPPVNALDLPMVSAIADAVLGLADRDALAVVFGSTGRTLAAGGDIKWMHEQASHGNRGELRTFLRTIQALMDDIERLPMPTIAVVTGPTLGGGLELAMACDMRVAADTATIGFPEATLGLLPAAGGTQRLVEVVGRGKALELLYTGRMFPAADGLALGLVNRVVPEAEVDGCVEELLEEVLRTSPAARVSIKACVLAGVHQGRARGLEVENAEIQQLAIHPDTVRRLTDFMESRSAPRRATG